MLETVQGDSSREGGEPSNTEQLLSLKLKKMEGKKPVKLWRIMKEEPLDGGVIRIEERRGN